MKNLLLFVTPFFFVLLLSHTHAQNLYANDWHQSLRGKPMVKVKVWEDGLHRISPQEIAAISPALANAPADSLRLFFRGNEVPLQIHFFGNPTWSELEFLGTYHDGGEDRLLYKNNIVGLPQPHVQTNPRVSLFSDTSVYFLVASGGTPALRWQNEGDFDYSQGSPESSLLYRSSINFLPSDTSRTRYITAGGGSFDSFNALNSDYVLGEGYVSRDSFGQGSPLSWTIPTPLAIPGNQSLNLSTRIFSRSNTTHRLRINEKGLNQSVLDTSWNSNQIYVGTYRRSFSAILGNNLELEFEALGTGSADDNHLVWIDIRYPRLPDMTGEASINVEEIPAGSLLRLENCLGADSVSAYHEASGQRFRGLMRGDTAWLNLSTLGLPGDLFIASDSAVHRPILAPAVVQPLCHADSGADMMIITHRSLEASARDYAAFRDGTGLSTKVFFIDEINDAFGYGTPGPLAVERFCNCAFNEWNSKPRYVLLWGDGGYITRDNPTNLIPTGGFPASDHMLTAEINSVNYVPQIPIGRLPIVHDSAGYNYLEKARIWADVNRRDRWMQTGTFAGGGASAGEQNAIGRAISEIRNDYASGQIQGDTVCYFQKTGNSMPPFVDSCLFEEAGLRYFFGHSSSNLFDVPLAKPGLYDDFLKPSFLWVNGCYGADFTQDTIMADFWLNHPDRGAIAWMGNTSPGYLSPLKIYSEIFMTFFAGSMVERPIGDVMKATISLFRDSVPGIQSKNHCRQMNLLGDPSLVLSRRGQPLSIVDTQTESTIEVYPNPTRDVIFVNIHKAQSIKAKLYDLQGRMVKESSIQGSELRLNVGELPSGTYLLRVGIGEEVFNKKVLISD
jgi:hypothetical protein